MMSIQILTDRYPELAVCAGDIVTAYEKMLAVYRSGGKMLFCGNGGSAADSEHIVGELMKGFLLKRPPVKQDRDAFAALFPEDADYFAKNLQRGIPAISLVSQSAVQTAFNNDVAADMVFAQQVYGYGRPGDLCMGITTSGNSKNVVNAIKVARAMGLVTIGLTGAKESKLSEICDVTIRVPQTETYRVQELHLPVYHWLCAALEDAVFAADEHEA
ncbi:MAG: SIS domain-containing protein [Clostridia bacterium]|nr:SIS domain-containing protein [Clostridia bacterium]